MKETWRRFAPVGLWLALLGALAAGVLFVLQRQWNIYLQISLALVIVGLALFAILDPERVRLALTGRQARYGSNAMVMGLAFLGILVVINYLIFNHSKRWDLTENKENTLAKETVATLQKLPAKVVAQAFFTKQTPSDQAKILLDQYKFASNGKFDYQFIDPVGNPVAAQQAGITRDGTIVLKMGDRTEPVTFAQEQEITSSLIKLMTNEKPSIYFLTGHGERNPNESGQEGYSTLKTTLENKNYKVDVLNLLATNAIPPDARVIVVAGPRQPITTQEVDLLKDFVSKGGSLIVMEEPTLVTDFGDAPDPLANYLAGTWGVKLGNDVVVDPNPATQQIYVAVANQYGSHPITDKLQGVVTLFPSARSVQTTGEQSSFTQTKLVETSSNAWAETDLQAIKDSQGQTPNISPDQGKDVLGPVTLAVAIESAQSKARLVIFGDSDFAVDPNFNQLANGDLIVNSIDWAALQENLINLTPKNTTQRVLIPPTGYFMGLLLLGSVIFLPGLMLVAGVVVWVQRRKRG